MGLYYFVDAVCELIEILSDRRDIKKARKDRSERFPLELVEKIAAGENSIKAFREYRGLSQTQLAEQVGISRQYMSQLESGDRTGGVKLLKKIATCLKVDLDDITS